MIYVETAPAAWPAVFLKPTTAAPEAYQYVKQFWVALCTAGLYRRTREVSYFGVGVIFAFLLLDDAFQMRELFGKWLAAQYSLPVAFGLRR